MPTPARARIVLPEELLEAVDRTAGKRKRSHFVEAAIREKLARDAVYAGLHPQDREKAHHLLAACTFLPISPAADGPCPPPTR